MTPGRIVLVDWRDALPSTGEPNKRRPAVVVSAPAFFGLGLPFEIVVPLTGDAKLQIDGATTAIEPTPENGCAKRSFALAWNLQTVPHARLMATSSRITDHQLAEIRRQIAAVVAAVGTD